MRHPLDVPKVRKAQEVMSQHLEAMEQLFEPGAKLTLLVRNPGHHDADIILTSDGFDEIIASVKQLKKRDRT